MNPVSLATQPTELLSTTWHCLPMWLKSDGKARLPQDLLLTGARHTIIIVSSAVVKYCPFYIPTKIKLVKRERSLNSYISSRISSSDNPLSTEWTERETQFGR